MKRYSMPFGRALDFEHPHPERTAVRTGSGAFSDNTYQVWPSREAMARSVRMQQSRASRADDWRPIVNLSDGEGY